MKNILLFTLIFLFSVGYLRAGDNLPSQGEAMQTIEGTLLYRERMFLPPNSMIKVTLEEISRADAPATIIASSEFEAPKSPPFNFTLQYDAAAIKDSNRHTIRAVISNSGQLLFTTTELIDPFQSSLKIMLYRAHSQKPDVTLKNTYWKLHDIKSQRVKISENLKEPHFILSDTNEVTGFSGCNRFFGTYSQSENTIAFSQLGMTKMACPHASDLENTFLNVLQEATHYKIESETLQLFNGTKVLASFRAVYF